MRPFASVATKAGVSTNGLIVTVRTIRTDRNSSSSTIVNLWTVSVCSSPAASMLVVSGTKNFYTDGKLYETIYRSVGRVPLIYYLMNDVHNRAAITNFLTITDSIRT